MKNDYCVYLDAGHGSLDKEGNYVTAPSKQFEHAEGEFHKGKWFFEEIQVNHGVIDTKTHQKILRYYISNKGSKLIKKNPDGRSIQLESGSFYQTIMNQYVKKDFDDYDINKKYYLDKIYSEIRSIQGGKLESDPVQLSFF